jgi:D-aspartate ligase
MQIESSRSSPSGKSAGPDRQGGVDAGAGAVIIGGDFQGLGIVTSLARHKIPVYLLDRGLCAGRFSRYVKRFKVCPQAAQENVLLEFLTNLAVEDGLDGWVVYPTDDETVRFLARHKEDLERHYRLITPSWDVVKYAYEKELTYKLAAECGVLAPRTFYPKTTADLARDIEFPVIIKPSIKDPFYTTTRKKAIRVDSRASLMDEFARATEAAAGGQLMLQELIPGGASSLFSVGSLFRDGEFLGRVVARRPRQHPMEFGHATTFAETVDIPELEELACRILSAMRYNGMSEVEFMRDPRDGRYKLLEINARPWGWHTLAIAAGVDLPYLAFLDRLGQRVKQEGFEKNVKWIRLTTDTPTVLGEWLKGRLSCANYFASLRGKKHFALVSLSDPLPFFAEIAMLPYLWKKRGF